MLDEKPVLPAGRVRVLLQAVLEAAPKEDWWAVMQRLRAELEAAGHHFLDEAEMEERIRELR